MKFGIAQIAVALALSGSASAFTPSESFLNPSRGLDSSTQLQAAALSPLPKDISPFEKSNSKSRDLQGEFRKVAQQSLQQAIKDGVTTLEFEFPPLIGGDKSKSQFDDFDNVQELNKNRDWCIELLPSLAQGMKSIWFILPDLKEVELAKDEWGGQRYLQAATFSSIEAVTQHYSGVAGNAEDYAKPWGSSIASGMSQLLGGDRGDAGLLGDQGALDSLEESNAKLHLVCQPGNGGPVEDWINVKKIHDAAGGTTPTCVVNGALDKVRDGYYAPFIFPALAKTFDFYRGFESVFFLKPISDKGVYGWLYRVYPEPWQVVLQTPTKDKNDKLVVVDTVALVSESRPNYAECVKALLSTASTR